MRAPAGASVGAAGEATERIFILGAGRAGRGLARAFRAVGAEVGLHGRRPDPGPDAVSAGRIPDALGGASVAIVAVQDAQLDAALRELVAARPRGDAVLLHASGSAEPAALPGVRAAGYAAGTFHPLLPLANPARAADFFRGGFVGVDGDARATAAAARLAAMLGARVLHIPPGEKARYHAAAVFASNFPTVLAGVAERLLRTIGVEGDAARGAVLSLMAAAVANLREQPAATALTGPVARGDAVTVRRHLAALESHRGARETYVALSRAAMDMLEWTGQARWLDEMASVLRDT